MNKQSRIIYYRRFSKTQLHHFSPAPGYHCPKIPLGGINCKGPDYEVVKVVETKGLCKQLKGRRVLISWGMNIPREKWPKIKQVLAVETSVFGSASYAEIVLAC